VPRATKDRVRSATGRQEIHIWIDADLRRRARMLAARQDVSLRDVIEMALRHYLEGVDKANGP
jgi:cytidylate kinase